MQFTAWQPIYYSILQDFGFSEERDEEAAELLAGILRGREPMLPAARSILSGCRAIVCGNAPKLSRELDELQDRNAIFLAADGATAVLLEHNIIPDIVVTDLDGPFSAILKANRMGSIVAVHAHGDNLDALKRYVPELKRVIGTVQCRPPPGLHSFGGFTDGDRTVFLARELGAASIELLGFDYEDESVTPRKKRKLEWAKRLIELALEDVPPQSLQS
jgi:2-amino-4-hydroxy-6-hydroxymethyldihydropteridine diphosphokinase